MKSKQTWFGVLATICILICGCQCPRTPARAWEYKVIEKALYPGELQKQIDTAVQDGWEFVSVSTTVQEASVPHGFIVVRRPKR